VHLINFGSLGFVHCRSKEAKAAVEQLPEDTFQWSPERPHCGYSQWAELESGVLVLAQQGASLTDKFENASLDVVLPPHAVLNAGRTRYRDDARQDPTLVSFYWQSQDYVIATRVVLPMGYRRTWKEWLDF